MRSEPGTGPLSSRDVASRDQLRLFIELVHEYAIFTIDLENRITTWNAGAGTMRCFVKIMRERRSESIVELVRSIGGARAT